MDTNKLKELAEAANRARSQWYTEDDCCWWTGNVDEGDFLAAANPQAILGLIAEMERLRKDAERYLHLRNTSMIAAGRVGKYSISIPHYEMSESDRLELDAFIDAALEGGGR